MAVLGAVDGQPAVNRPQSLRSSFDTATVRAHRRSHHRVEDDVLAGDGREYSSYRCTAACGEKIVLADGVTMRVVRWNHSGDSATNPSSTIPSNLTGCHGWIRKQAVARGCGRGLSERRRNRAFLFVVDSPSGRFSRFFQNPRVPTCRYQLSWWNRTARHRKPQGRPSRPRDWTG